MSKNRYFVQYNDGERNLYNAPSEITKYFNWVKSNNETKPLRLKYTIIMGIFQSQFKKEIREK